MKKNYFLLLVLLLIGFCSVSAMSMHTTEGQDPNKATVTYPMRITGGGINVLYGFNMLYSGDQVDLNSTIKINPFADMGYELVSFTINEEEKMGELVGEVYEMVVTEDIEINAVFVVVGTKAEFTVTYPTEVKGGALNVKVGEEALSSGSIVELNTTLQIAPVPNKGYHLSSLLVNGKERKEKLVDGVLTYVVKGDVAIEAAFEVSDAATKAVISYPMAIEGGSIEVKAGSEVLSNGSEVDLNSLITISPLPNEGYEIGSLTVNGEEMKDALVDSQLIYEVTGDVNISAAFVKKTSAVVTYPINVSGGSINVMSNFQVVISGSEVEMNSILKINPLPDNGFKLDLFTINGEDRMTDLVGGVLDYVVTGDVEIDASFSMAQELEKFPVHITVENADADKKACLKAANGTVLDSGSVVVDGCMIALHVYLAMDNDLVSAQVNGREVKEEILLNEVSESKGITEYKYEFLVNQEMNVLVQFADGSGIATEQIEQAVYNPETQQLEAPEDVRVEVFDATGVRVAATNGSVDMSAFNDGVYLVRIMHKNQLKVVKILK